jgi:disulfide bond formation protein DsbB
MTETVRETETEPESQTSLDPDWIILFVCWLLVSGATLGSLFFSEIMELPPCSLCWAQRIFMFPLAIILLLGLFPFDAQVVRYAWPLAAIGAAVALYHLLLQAGVIPESAAPCRQGVSCTEAQVEILGFISIPVLSLLVFAVVTGLLLLLKRRQSL